MCKCVAQVTATDVRLLRDVHQIYQIPLDRGGGIRACDLCDPYAVILLVDGSVAMVELVEKGEEGEGGDTEEAVTLQLTWPGIKEVCIKMNYNFSSHCAEIQGSKVTLLSSYTDKSGLFTSELEDERDEEGEAPAAYEPGPASTEEAKVRTEAEEEDELLYGDIDALTNREKLVRSIMYLIPFNAHPFHLCIYTYLCMVCLMCRMAEPVRSKVTGEKSEEKQKVLADSHWCVLCREDGSMEVSTTY